MKISVMSDIHCRNNSFPPSFHEEDMAPADALVVAGDLGTAVSHDKVKSNLKILGRGKFGKVITVRGNHDYYVHPQMRKNQYPEPSVEDNDWCWDEKHNVVFLCTPMWTPITRHREITLWMNDYSYIPGFTTEKGTELFWQNLKWLEEKMEMFRGKGPKTVVVTHHLPLPELIDPAYEGSEINEAFCVMDPAAIDRIRKLNPDLWIHGHSHQFCDKTIDGTRYVRNPYGYEWPNHDYGGTKKEITDYVKDFTVEI